MSVCVSVEIPRVGVIFKNIFSFRQKAFHTSNTTLMDLNVMNVGGRITLSIQPPVDLLVELLSVGVGVNAIVSFNRCCKQSNQRCAW